MNDQVADEDFGERGLGYLERELGPVLTLRFLASISRQTFDYQAWREAHFGGMSLNQVLSGLKGSARQLP